MADQPENPINDLKSTAEGAKKTVRSAKWAVRAVKLARSFAPVGAALLAKDIANKIPLVGPLARKINDLAKKVAIGGGVGAIGLIMLLLGKLLALAGYIAVGTAIGFAVGGLPGAIVGAAISATVGPQIVSAITSSAGVIKGATGAVSGAVSGITGGISSAISGAFSAVGGALSGAVSGFFGALGGAANFLVSLGSLTLPTSFVAIPVFSGIGAITIGSLFIGGFIAPAAFFSVRGDAQNFTPSQNEFFTVSKTVTPNKIANQPAGQTQQVEFTITLTAKATRLTNVQINDELTPAIQSITVSCPSTIEPNTTCTQSFIVGIDSTHNDSTVTNTVRVTATPEGQPNATAIASASVIIGSPVSSNCFIFQGGWTQSEQDLEIQAINKLNQAPSYLSQVCSKGQVILQRDNSDGWNQTFCPNLISISNRGLGSIDNTTYTLAHESGHIVQCNGSQWWPDFINAKPINEGFICSYPLRKTELEDFAESIAIHITWKTHVSNACGSINYPSAYPLHHNFTTSLFGGVQF